MLKRTGTMVICCAMMVMGALNSRADIVFVYPVTGKFIDIDLGDGTTNPSEAAPALEAPAGEGE